MIVDCKSLFFGLFISSKLKLLALMFLFLRRCLFQLPDDEFPNEFRGNDESLRFLWKFVVDYSNILEPNSITLNCAYCYRRIETRIEQEPLNEPCYIALEYFAVA